MNVDEIYNKGKIEYIKKSVCQGCKILPCKKTPEMLSICIVEAFEYRMRSGKYGTQSPGNEIVQNINNDIKGVVICDEVINNGEVEKYNTTVKVEDINRLFINRTDSYSLQDKKEPKKFPDVSQPLTDDVILRHLLGSITIGIRPINPETKKIKWICWDIDKDHNDKPKIVVSGIVKNLKEWYNLTGYIEKSGSNNSYHVWIFLEQTDNDVAFEFNNNFMERLKVYFKVNNITLNEKSIDKGVQKGNKLGSVMIKLPFGVQRKNGKRSSFVKTFSDFSKIKQEKLNMEKLI